MNSPLNPAIEVKGVKRVFKSVKKEEGLKASIKLLTRPEYIEKEALKGIRFSIESGSFIGLIGANGAGKTTLLKILSGLIQPTAGEARVLGFDPFERKIEFRKQIALVMGQKAQLWWDLPAVDAFDLIRAIYEIPRPIYKERLELLTSLLDVKKLLSTQIRRLSLGERMKMELIGAILHWPKIIFLDEPTIGLDVLAAHKLREFLKEFNQREKATIILTSHNMDDIEELCSRVLILKSGELVYDGKPGGLTRAGECRLRVRLVKSAPIADLAQATELAQQNIQAGEADEGQETSSTFFFEIKRDQVVHTLQKLMNHFSVIDMGIEEQSLESVIQRIYAGASIGQERT